MIKMGAAGVPAARVIAPNDCRVKEESGTGMVGSMSCFAALFYAVYVQQVAFRRYRRPIL